MAEKDAAESENPHKGRVKHLSALFSTPMPMTQWKKSASPTSTRPDSQSGHSPVSPPGPSVTSPSTPPLTPVGSMVLDSSPGELTTFDELKAFDAEQYGRDTTDDLVRRMDAVDPRAVFKEILTEYTGRRVNIGVTGRTGTGKSTLINTLRGLTPRDEHAARSGEVETTVDIRPYPYPNCTKLIIWDIPGVGTKAWPTKTYIRDIALEKFDAIIIVTADRFCEEDMWLAKEADIAKVPFYMVRNKIDESIANAADSEISAKELMTMVRANILDNLEGFADRSKLFLISAKLANRHLWDFEKLVDALVTDTTKSDKVKQLMVMGMAACSEKLIVEKQAALEKRIPIMAGAAANLSDDLHEDYIDDEVDVYMRWFGFFEHAKVVHEQHKAELKGNLDKLSKDLDLIISNSPSQKRKLKSWNRLGKWIDQKKTHKRQLLHHTDMERAMKKTGVERKKAIEETANTMLNYVLRECVTAARARLCDETQHACHH